MSHLRKQRLDVRLRQGLGQRPTETGKMTRLDWIAQDEALLQQEIKEVFEGIETTIQRGGSEVLLLMSLDKVCNIAVRHGGGQAVMIGKEQREIELVVLTGMVGIWRRLR
jgi:hypothetical protein